MAINDSSKINNHFHESKTLQQSGMHEDSHTLNNKMLCLFRYWKYITIAMQARCSDLLAPLLKSDKKI